MTKFTFAQSRDGVSFKSAKLVPAEPEESDLKRIDHLKSVTGRGIEAVVFLVKIYVTGIPITSVGMQLFIGDEPVTRYWPFKGGIYFIVYDPAFFTTHRDDHFQYSLDSGATIVRTDVVLPRLLQLREITSFQFRAFNEASHLTLPSKSAALSE